MTGILVAVRAAQDVSRGGEALGQLAQRHRAHPGRGELDRQRQPVEPPADPCHERRTRGRRARTPVAAAGRGRRTVRRPRSPTTAARSSDSGSASNDIGQSCSPAMPSGSRLVASTDTAGRPARICEVERARRADHVLAVVEDQQQRVVTDRGDDRRRDRRVGRARGRRAATGRGHRARPRRRRRWRVERARRGRSVRRVRCLAADDRRPRARGGSCRRRPVPTSVSSRLDATWRSSSSTSGLSRDQFGERERWEVAGLHRTARCPRSVRAGSVARTGSGPVAASCAVVGEDRPFHGDQLGTRIETELVDEQSAALLERPQGVGLATLPIEPVHQQRPRPLAERVGGDQLGEPDDGVVGTAERQLGSSEVLVAGEVCLPPPGDRSPNGVEIGEVGERVAPPEREPSRSGADGRRRGRSRRGGRCRWRAACASRSTSSSVLGKWRGRSRARRAGSRRGRGPGAIGRPGHGAQPSGRSRRCRPTARRRAVRPTPSPARRCPASPAQPVVDGRGSARSSHRRRRRP